MSTDNILRLIVISGVNSARRTDRCERQIGPQGRLTMVNIQALIDDAKCFQTVRVMRDALARRA